MRYARLLSALLLAFVLSPAAIAGDAKQALLGEYRPAVKRLREFYGAVTISGTETQSYLAKSTATERVVLYSNGESLRIDTVLGPTSKQPGSTVVGVSTSTGAFAVTRAAAATAYALQDLKADKIRTRQSMQMQHAAFFAPYCDIGGSSILDRLDDEKTIVFDTREERNGDDSFVTVTLSYQPPPSPRGKVIGRRRGEYTFWKNRSWALRESKTEGEGTGENRLFVIVDYLGAIGDIPLLKHVDFWREQNGQKAKLIDLQVDQITPGAVADAEFKLSAFGIGEVAQETRSGTWLVLILGGVLLIGIAAMIGRFALGRRGSGQG